MKYSVVESFTINSRIGPLVFPVGKLLELTEEQAAKLKGKIRAADVPTPAPSDWRPEFKAWLEGDSLRTTGVCDDLAGEIVKLTADNLPLQKKLLTAHCGIFYTADWQNIARKLIDRAAEIFDKEGVDHRTAMYRAAEEMKLLAFEKELDIKFHPPVEQDTPPF